MKIRHAPTDGFYFCLGGNKRHTHVFIGILLHTRKKFPYEETLKKMSTIPKQAGGWGYLPPHLLTTQTYLTPLTKRCGLPVMKIYAIAKTQFQM